MSKTAYFDCSKCGERNSVDNILLDGDESGIAVVRYDPNSIKKVILVNSLSGARQEVTLSSGKHSKVQDRHIAGIIGPY